MNIAVVCTGTELLKGATVNSNLAKLGAEMTASGIPLSMEIAVGDRREEIGSAIASAMKSADVLILCGGLGPTRDDITLDVACSFFGCALERSPELEEKVAAFWSRIHTGHCPENQFRQARVPAGGHYLPNPVGSASGIDIATSYAGCARRVFLAPGPPSEFEPMVKNFIVPAIAAMVPERVPTRGFLCAGVGESTVAATLEKPVTAAGVEIAYCADASGTRVFLSGADTEKLEKADRLAHELRGDSAMPDGILDPVSRTIQLLNKCSLRLATAESCTGGLIASMLVEHSGVSSVYAGGAVTYSNELKHTVLGVPRELLDTCGAVSEECARAMAQGACEKLGADVSVAVTGIAGPDGGTPEKPVGLVYVSACVKGEIQVKKLNLRGGRAMIRRRAAAQALILLNRMLEKL